MTRLDPNEKIVKKYILVNNVEEEIVQGRSLLDDVEKSRSWHSGPIFARDEITRQERRVRDSHARSSSDLRIFAYLRPRPAAGARLVAGRGTTLARPIGSDERAGTKKIIERIPTCGRAGRAHLALWPVAHLRLLPHFDSPFFGAKTDLSGGNC